MKQLYTWGAVAAIVLASTIGDVLLSRSMKQVGHVGELWRTHGLLAVVGRTLHNVNFVLGILAMTVAFYSLLIGLSWGDVSLVAPAFFFSSRRRHTRFDCDWSSDVCSSD